MLRVMRSIKRLVIHCSASINGRAYTIADIDRWHRERGFRRSEAARRAFKPELASIGYHYVIEIDGALCPGRLPDEVGAHAAGHNADSIGVCLVGTDAFTARQWHSLVRVIGEMGARFGQLQIVGHRDLSPDTDGDGVVERHEWLKTCPGFDVAAWLAAGMRTDAQHLLPNHRAAL